MTLEELAAAMAAKVKDEHRTAGTAIDEVDVREAIMRVAEAVQTEATSARAWSSLRLRSTPHPPVVVRADAHARWRLASTRGWPASLRRKANRAATRRYPFLRHMPRMQELMADRRKAIVQRAVTETINKDLPVGVTVRFTPYIDGELQAPVYPCNWCGKLRVAVRGALCDDCIPF